MTPIPLVLRAEPADDFLVEVELLEPGFGEGRSILLGLEAARLVALALLLGLHRADRGFLGLLRLALLRILGGLAELAQLLQFGLDLGRQDTGARRGRRRLGVARLGRLLALPIGLESRIERDLELLAVLLLEVGG